MNASPSRHGFRPASDLGFSNVAPEELLGLADIARTLGVSKRTAQNYVRREDFPQPLGRIAAGPVWRREDVAQWAKTTLPLRLGRPPKRAK